VNYRQRAQAFVEFALVLPLLLVLIGGGIDLARVYFMGIETSNGAAQAALYVADNSSNTSGPTSFSATNLASVVKGSYAGSPLGCSAVTVVQNQSTSASGPTGVNSDTYPTSGSFYEYVTVKCAFTPLTPFIPVSLTLKATSSDYVVEATDS
jgi:Flp pilus assembly protein TadG